MDWSWVWLCLMVCSPLLLTLAVILGCCAKEAFNEYVAQIARREIERAKD